jgi:hypothetical protein
MKIFNFSAGKTILKSLKERYKDFLTPPPKKELGSDNYKLVRVLHYIKKILFAVLTAGVAVSLLFFVPQIRAAIILFAENFIAHHSLNESVWNGRMLKFSTTFLLFVSVVLFALSQKKTPRNIFIIVSILGITSCICILDLNVRSGLIELAQILKRSPVDFNTWNNRFLKLALPGLYCFISILFLSVKDFGFVVSNKLTHTNKQNLYLIAKIVLIGAFICASVAIAASNNSVWVDEVYSLVPAHHSFKEILMLQSYDLHPPLFWIMERIWMILFSDSVFSIKILVILSSVLTMIFGAIFLTKEYSNKAAIIFLLALSASQTVMHQSVEIRMYNWAFFFVTMVGICSYYIIKTSRIRWWALFLVFAECTAYTHLYAAACSGIIFCLLFVYIIIKDKKQIKISVATAIIAIILYLPWVRFILYGFKGASNNFWIGPITFDVIKGFLCYPFITGNSFLSTAFSAIFVLSLFFLVFKKQKKVKDFFAFGMLSCPIILLITGIVISLLTRPLLVARYLYPSLGLLFLFFAIAFNSIKNKRLVTFVCIILSATSIISYLTKLNAEAKEGAGYNKFYTFMSENIKESDLIVFDPKLLSVGHITGIISYLFHDNIQVAQTAYTSKPKLKYSNGTESLYAPVVFDTPRISFDDFLNLDKTQGVWMFLPYDQVFEDDNIKSYGRFTCDWYSFYLYYAENLKKEIKIDLFEDQYPEYITEVVFAPVASIPFPDKIKTNDIKKYALENGVLTLECGKTDPFFMLTLEKPLDLPDEKTYLEMQYTSTTSGDLQIFFDYGNGFTEEKSLRYNMVSNTDAPVTIKLQIRNWKRGEKLIGMRFDPPNGSKFVLYNANIIKEVK